MRRFLTIASILMVLSCVTSATAGEFGWTLSASSTDALANTGSPLAGLVNVYLWFYCTNTLGLASAEFDVTGSAAPLSFTAANGFLNAGGATNLLLAVGGCPGGPLYAGTFLIFDAAGLGFNLCTVPSAGNGLNVSVECVTLQTYENDFIGFASDGTNPCTSVDNLCLVGLDGQSWGEIKSLYR